jgi:hypothetical protein
MIERCLYLIIPPFQFSRRPINLFWAKYKAALGTRVGRVETKHMLECGVKRNNDGAMHAAK